MVKYYFCYIPLICIFAALNCDFSKDKMLYIFYFNNKQIETNGKVIKTFSAEDTLHIYSDTVYTLAADSTGELYLISTGANSNITGIFYLCKSNNRYKVISQAVDPYTVFDIKIYFHNLDHKEPKEIISIWNHEGDIYYIKIDKIIGNKKVQNLYTSKDLGVPTLENGQIMTIEKDTLLFLYMLDDGTAHEKAFIKYEADGNLSLQVIQEIPN